MLMETMKEEIPDETMEEKPHASWQTNTLGTQRKQNESHGEAHNWEEEEWVDHMISTDNIEEGGETPCEEKQAPIEEE